MSPAVRQYGFFIDTAACSGCKACQMACKDRNDLKPGILWRRVYEVAGGGWEKTDGLWIPGLSVYNVSMACNHCENPVCGHPCPTKAVWKRPDGIVLIDEGACIGCRACEWACPYLAVRFDMETNKASKCDFCVDRIDAGEPPACVAACPQRAIDFGDIDALRKTYGAVNRVIPLPDPTDTRPALVIRPHRDAARAEERNAEVINWEEV